MPNERRTHPGFLSHGEAARDSARTSAMVQGFLRWNTIQRIGETNNFTLEFDRTERTVLLYGKETPKGCPFKLAFDENETEAITNLLTKAKDYFHKH